MVDLDELRKINPVNTYEKSGTAYEYEYMFGEVHLDELDVDDIDVSGTEVELVDGSVLKWGYKGKPTVYLTKSEVFANVANSNSRKQAYFALSVLESKGLVSGWGRK